MDIISRKEAINIGIKTYYTGKQCKNGHISERRVDNRVCVECALKRSALWKKENSHHVKSYFKKWSEENKDNRAEYNKNWYENNFDYEKRRELFKRNPQSKIAKSLRDRVYAVLINGRKSASTMDLIGASVDEVKLHIEKQFKPGMSWDNYSYRVWHIDHIIPLASFDLTVPEEQKKAFNYTNLQPLWAGDNLRKGSKIIK